jgi:hypothetical protein
MEIYKDNESKTNHISFKVSYKVVQQKELRVYMNGQNKISAIKSMDWSAVLKKIIQKCRLPLLNSSLRLVSTVIQIEK